MAKIRIERNALSKPASEKAKVSPASFNPTLNRKPAVRRDDGAGLKVWLGIGGVIGVVIVACLISEGIRNARAANQRTQDAADRTEQAAIRAEIERRSYERKKFDDLGGLTMTEWMARNNTNNTILKARQERVRGSYSRSPVASSSAAQSATP